jgi:phosphoribosylformylglycinamidine synthase subunit PurSL
MANMLVRFEIAPKPGLPDVLGEKVAGKVRNELGLAVEGIGLIKIYTVAGLREEEVEKILELGVLHDPVSNLISITPLAATFDWALEVGFRPGVTDNEARTASEAIHRVLGLTPDRSVSVSTSSQYLLRGKFTRSEVEHIAKDLLANELIQRFQFKSKEAWAAEPGFSPEAVRVTGESKTEVATIPLLNMSDQELTAFSRENVLALSLEELYAIQAYYGRDDVRTARERVGLDREPTDAEIEALAQTWSEHCKHKIFNSRIHYENREKGSREIIDSLYATFIQGSTKTLRRAMGENDFCLSVFKDNAGVIRFNQEYSVCIKVETHNSPSALDPYGGALTGIVGVNRDPMGTGMGANLLCNTDVFCFARPFMTSRCPRACSTPVGCSKGCAKEWSMGATSPASRPSTGGSFSRALPRQTAVFCGTVGIMPSLVQGRPSHEKKALAGDRIVMLGGRIGKDGIHGATFSSEELHEGSPATAVQIGDPITQRKMYDFIMRARDRGLYRAITDNGAGGLSSSVGEMARDTGGCEMDLSLAPLEVRRAHALGNPALRGPGTHDRGRSSRTAGRVSGNGPAGDGCRSLGSGGVHRSGAVHVRHGNRTVAFLEMDFLHDGTPQMELEAVWEQPAGQNGKVIVPAVPNQEKLLKSMLGRLNICSKRIRHPPVRP